MGYGQAYKPKTADHHAKPAAHHDAPVLKPQLPAFSTGNDYIDKGPVCEREGVQATCVLEPEQRHRAIQDLRDAKKAVVSNYCMALQDAELELLLNRPNSLGFAADLLLGVALAVVTDGLSTLAVDAVAAAARVATWTEHVSPGIASTIIMHKGLAQGLIKQAGAAARSPLRDVLRGASHADKAKLMLLASLKDGAVGLFDGMVDAALAHGDDLTLLVLRSALDPKELSVAAFAKHIAAMLARFSNSFDDIGATHYRHVEDGAREVVKITCGTRSRFAVIDTRYSIPYEHEDGGFAQRTPFEGQTFVRWIADEFQDIAGDVQAQRSGEPRILDINDPALTFCAPVALWALQGAK